MSAALTAAPPRTDAQWARQVTDRLTMLEQRSTARAGDWVLRDLDGDLIASKPGAAVNLSVPVDPAIETTVKANVDKVNAAAQNSPTGNWMADIWAAVNEIIGTIVGTAVGTVAEGLVTLGSWAAALAGGAAGIIASIVGAIVGGGATLLSELVTWAGDVYTGVTGAVSDIAALIANAGGTVIADLTAWLTTAYNNATSAAADIASMILAAGGLVITDLTTWLVNGYNAATGAAADIAAMILTAGGTVIADLTDWMTSTASDAAGAVADIATLIAAAGGAAITDLVTWLTDAYDAGTGAAADIAALILNAGGTVIADLTAWLTDAYDAGTAAVADIAALIANAGGTVIADLEDWLTAAYDTATGAAADIAALILAAGGTVIADLSDFITTAASDAASAVSDIALLIANVGGTIISDLWDWFSSLFDTAGDAYTYGSSALDLMTVNRTNNLVIDGAFESQSTYWANAWGVADQIDFYTGTQSRKLFPSGGGRGTDRIVLTHDAEGNPAQVELAPNSTVSVSFWAYAGGSKVGVTTMYLTSHYLDGGEQTYAEYPITYGMWTDGDWQQFSTTFTTPADPSTWVGYLTLEFPAGFSAEINIDSVYVIDITSIRAGLTIQNATIDDSNTVAVRADKFSLRAADSDLATFDLSALTGNHAYTLPDAAGTLLLTSGNAASATTAGKATNLVGGNNTTLLGAMPYQSNTDVTTLLGPNTTTTKKFLRQTGSGTNGAAPAWDTIVAGDVPTLNQNTTGSAAKLTTARAINGVNFDGTAAINIPGAPVVTTATGGTGTEDGANTWAKVCTFATGTNQWADCGVILGVTIDTTSTHACAVIAAFFRSNATGADPTVDVRIISESGSATHLAADSFKVISGGWSTDMELWVRKVSAYCKLAFYEISKISQLGTLTYTTNPAWQSATPTGAVRNVSSDGVFSGLKVTAPNFVSTVATGTAPLAVTSTTEATNLHAATATKLHTARNINGISFDGSANIDLGSATPAASTLAQWDASKNMSAENFLTAQTPYSGGGSTQTLTIDSTRVHKITGSGTWTFKLPTTGIKAGCVPYIIVNQCTNAVTVQSSGAETITTLAQNEIGYFTPAVDDPTLALSWNTTVMTNGTLVRLTNVITLDSAGAFTNKEFDANATGNTLSNVELDDFAADTICDTAATVSGNDVDTMLPTNAAVIDYVAGAVEGGGVVLNISTAWDSKPAAATEGRLLIPTDCGTIAIDSGAAWVRKGIYPGSVAPTDVPSLPNNSTLGSATMAAQADGVLLNCPSAAGDHLRVWYKTLAASSNYKVEAHIEVAGAMVSYTHGGLFLRSSGGLYMGIGLTYDAGYYLRVSKWNSESSYASTPVQVRTYELPYGMPRWMRWRDDNSNRYAEVSGDGSNWTVVQSEGRTVFMTANAVGLAVFSNNGSASQLLCRSFKEY